MVRPVGNNQGHSPKPVEMSGDLVASVVLVHDAGSHGIHWSGNAHKPLSAKRLSLDPHTATTRKVTKAFRRVR